MSTEKTVEKKKISLKKIQEEVVGTSEDIWLAGLGVFSTVEAEGAKMFDKFVEKGKDLVEKGKKIEKEGRKQAKSSASTATSKMDEAVKFVEGQIKNIGQTVIQPFGISSKEEVKDLTEKVDKLTDIVMVLAEKLDQIQTAVEKKS